MLPRRMRISPLMRIFSHCAGVVSHISWGVFGVLRRKSNDCFISGSVCCLPVYILTSPAASVMVLFAVGVVAAAK